ncbi:MAG: M48 family metalloprotease [Proteobacteria bacterium]|nr:M48 family metalloprotease [Pseudomonadota bacterium]
MKHIKFSMKILLIYSIIFFFGTSFGFQKAYCLTVKEEEKLAVEFLKAVAEHYEIVDDPVLVKYINDIGGKILAAAPPQPFTYRFNIIKDENFNAFAGPAGNVFFHSGLIEAMDNEEELAGIMAHEITHVVCRHLSDRFEKSKKIEIATLAGMAAGILLGAGGAGDAGNALLMGTAAMGQSLSLAYSREDEIQADQIGLNYLRKAGYTGDGTLSMLKKIRDKRWYDPNDIPVYLSTHPAVEDRINYLSNRIEENAGASNKKSVLNNDNFEKAHTRLLVMYGNKENVLKMFKEDVNKHPKDIMAQYKYALILSQNGNRLDAVEYFKKALEKNPFDPEILRDLGKTYFQDGRYPEAQKTLEGAISLAPDDPETQFFLGRIKAETGKLKEARDLFLNITGKYPFYNMALYYLGETSGKMDNMADAHYYLGLFYINKKDDKNARFHFEKALEKTEDKNRKSEIEDFLEKYKKKGKKAPKEKS